MSISPSADLVRALLASADDAMPGQRYQDPKIETRSDVPRPYYYIRPYVPMLTPDGLQRRQKRIPLGFTDEMTMRKAKAKKEEVMATINAGKFFVGSQIPFSEVLTRFKEIRIPQLGAATQEKYRHHIENHVEPAFAGMRMCDVDRMTIEAWLTPKAQTLGHWTLLDLRNLLSAIFTKAIEWKLWQGENPCRGLKVGGVSEKREKKIPAADGLQRFLAAIPETTIMPASGVRLMVLAAVTATLRVSEVLGLQARDIEPAARTLSVQRRWHRGDLAEPKSKASRRRRQIGGLADELLRYARGRRPDEFIFSAPGQMPPDDRDLQQHVFRPAAEAAKIYFPGFGMHTFRRLSITWRQTIGGATIFEAQKAAGHAQPSTTWMYTILDDGREAEQVARLWERLSSESDGGVN